MKNITIKNIIMLLALLISCFAVNAQSWQPLGYAFPANRIGQVNGIERTTQIKFHPTDPKTLYAVTAMGGLFISKDEGANWAPTGTDNLPFCRMSCVCIDYTNPRIMYLGTGDPNYNSSNESIGIYKSTDGGITWTSSSSGMGNILVTEILMSPTDHNVLIASTISGIYKSINGGATWTLKQSTGNFTDMIFKPGSSTTIYAAEYSGFYVSTNAGDTWTQISLPATDGLYGGGRIGVSSANTSVVYLTYVGYFGSTSTTSATPVLKSTNSGTSFSVVKTGTIPNLNGYDGNSNGQGNYNYDITVDPANANTVYIVGHVVWKSTNGGTSWTQMSNWANKIHTDMHHIVFSPHDSSKLYNANDGGIWVSTDGGWTWTPKSDGLAGLEIYHAAASPIKRAILDIGSQDNGEAAFDGTQWVTIGGGDYADKLSFGYLNNDEVYSHTGSRKTISTNSGASLNFPITPGSNGNDVQMAFTPLQTNVAFLGQTDVWVTTNLGSSPSWTKISNFTTQVQALAVSPTDANVLYVVTSDGKVRRSDNALSASPTFSIYNAPAATNVMASITVIKSNTNIVYITCGSSVYKSTDKGATWTTNLSSGLPSVNIMKIYHDTYSTDESVYIGTAKAVYYRNNTMGSWLNYSTGLPTVADMTDFMLYNDGTQNSDLYVSFKGRGVWRSSLYGKLPLLREPENPSVAVSGLSYKYYEGTWNFIPNFNILTSAKTGTVTTFDLTPKNRNNQIAFVYTGYINVPTDGQYTFYTSSADGSQLYIGNLLVVNNDGEHSTTEKSGSLGLKAGKHAITVYYFNNLSSPGLTVSYAGPGITKQSVPASALYTLPTQVICNGSFGSFTRELWTGISGSSVTDIPLTNVPASITTKTLAEETINQDDNYGVRYRGYICAPYTGNYTFWVASDDGSELWLSTDTTIVKRQKIAYTLSSTGSRDYDRYASQKSSAISLVAGQKYFLEALFKEGGGDDNFSIGWQLPSGEYERPIAGMRFSPFNANIPIASITTPANNAVFLAGSNITFNSTASISGGTISKVEYYNGGTKLGEATASPYAFTWTNVSAGSYTVTALAIDNNGKAGASQSILLSVQTPRIPENPASTTAGLDYKYYEGNWSALPDFSTLTPVKTGTVLNYDLSVRNINDLFGMSFTGYVNVPSDGLYNFYTSSDDGSNLYIGTSLVVNNDGLHGDQERTGTIALKAGKHAITVNFFEQGGGESLTVSYDGPGVSKQTIPNAALFRATGNVNPTVSITSPSNNAVFATPATVTINASAADADGTISKVEFYNGTTLLGTSTSSPYSYAWSGITAGTYSLTAKAYDNLNATTTSSAISITVEVAPSVSLTSPVNNASYNAPATITISANASDSDGSISKVEFYQGTTLLNSDNNSPYSYNWTGVAAGNYAITAKAYDNLNLTTTSSVVNVSVNAMPVVSITAPANNATYTAPASVAITASASDADGTISKVEFYQGTTLLGTATASPYSYTWSSVAAGTYSLTAKAYDNLNAVTTSSAISITVNPAGNVAPSVSITAPANNATYNAPASVTITANATDSDGTISKVEFYQGTTLLTTVTTSPYSYNWTNVSAGSYSITAKAYDNLNAATTSTAVNIIVNALPTVSITSPVNNATFTAPASITINATASDADGTISKVEFYQGTTLLGTATTSPYSYSWTSVAAGSYSLTAKAYDNRNAVTTSSAVSITVNTGSTCTAQQWVSTNAYNGGAIVQYLGIKYIANWWTQGEQPDLNNGPTGSGKPWTSQGTCTSKMAGDEIASTVLPSICYPNPFDLNSTLSIQITNAEPVTITLYNIQGEKVALIHDGYLEAGNYTFTIDGSNLREGNYICKIISVSKNETITLSKVRKPVVKK